MPSEKEWERAARHTDGRTWAWGDEWEDGIINSAEAGINRTTAVGSFPRGAAACGAQDMSGNVWEWTALFYDKRQDAGYVRGGSWISYRGDARVASRSWTDPDSSYGSLGFSVGLPRVLTAGFWFSDFCNGGFGGCPPNRSPRSGSRQKCAVSRFI